MVESTETAPALTEVNRSLKIEKRFGKFLCSPTCLFNLVQTPLKPYTLNIAECRPPQVTPILNRRGYKARMGVYEKKCLLKRLAKTGGGHSLIANVLSNHRGYASITQNIRSRIYRDKARDQFRTLASCSFSWDSASYGGLSVNICYAIDPFTLQGAHCKPLVASAGAGDNAINLSFALVRPMCAGGEKS